MATKRAIVLVLAAFGGHRMLRREHARPRGPGPRCKHRGRHASGNPTCEPSADVVDLPDFVDLVDEFDEASDTDAWDGPICPE